VTAAAALKLAAANTPIALVLIDDNRLLREGLIAMIHTQPGFRVLAAFAEVDEAMAAIREAKPDVVLLDLGVSEQETLALAGRVRTDVPTARIIIMGMRPRQRDIAEFVHAGVAGFIMKDASFEEFFTTIGAVAGGAQVLPDVLTGTLFTQIAKTTKFGAAAPPSAIVKLTKRELEIVEMLGHGLSNKEISARLHIAVHTVKSHVHNILEKLARRSRLEVAAFTHAMREKRPKTS